MPRDQHRLGLASRPRPALLVTTPTASTTGTTRVVGQRAQQPVLVPREPRRQRLERVERLAVAHEAHDVAVDAARDLDEALALPLGERLAPGQIEEVRVARAHEHLEARGLAHAILCPAARESTRRRRHGTRRARSARAGRCCPAEGRAAAPAAYRHTPGRPAMAPHATNAHRLPDALRPLERLAQQPALELGRGDRRRARGGRPRTRAGNPVATLVARAARRGSRRWPPTPASSPAWRAPTARLDSHLTAPAGTRRCRTRPARSPTSRPSSALSEALPQYSGGLGILAGDHLKAASDLGVPIVGIGLFYRNGYFRQLLTAARRAAGGVRRARSRRCCRSRRVARPDGSRVQIAIPLPGATLHAALWRVDVGRVPLLPARHRRARERPGRARRHRPPLRRRQRAPPAPGDPARHRRRQGAGRRAASSPPSST